MRRFRKDPQARLDYTIDWTSKIQLGDSIVASQWYVDDPEGTLSDYTHNTQTTTVWISGGIDSETYEVTNRITTAEGRIDERTIILQVFDH